MRSPDASLDFEQDPHKNSLGQLLARVSRLVSGRMRKKLEGTGLHHAQAMILFHLWREDGVAQHLLARSLHITAPTACNTLQRMEREGWIRRQRGASDQRLVHVFMTEKAKALRAETRTSFQELDRELASTLDDDERVIFMQALLKVHRLLQAGVAAEGSDLLQNRDHSSDEAGVVR